MARRGFVVASESPIAADDLGVQVGGEQDPGEVGDEEPERGAIDVAGGAHVEQLRRNQRAEEREGSDGALRAEDETESLSAAS